MVASSSISAPNADNEIRHKLTDILSITFFENKSMVIPSYEGVDYMHAAFFELDIKVKISMRNLKARFHKAKCLSWLCLLCYVLNIRFKRLLNAFAMEGLAGTFLSVAFWASSKVLT